MDIVVDEIVSDIADCLDVVVIHIYIDDFGIIVIFFGCSYMAMRPKELFVFCKFKISQQTSGDWRPTTLEF